MEVYSISQLIAKYKYVFQSQMSDPHILIFFIDPKIHQFYLI
jgi:hypothetical protein